MKPADYARLLLLAALWGASFLFMRIAAPALGSLFTASVRVMLSVASLAVFLTLLHVPLHLGQHLRATLLLGVVNTAIPLLMYALAARVLPAGYSAILNATTPLMGVIIGAVFFGESVDARKMLGVVVGLAGVAALTVAGPMAVSPAIALGTVACLVATACYGASGFLTRRWIAQRGGLDSRLVAFGSQVGACLALLPFFAVSIVQAPASLTVDLATPSVLCALLALGVVCTAFGYILYFRLVDDIGPVRCLTVTFLIPPFGVLWGALILGEQVTWAHLVGSVIIALALMLVLGPSSLHLPGQRTLEGSPR
jgi:drug/metabolite transporter (DMT)-like permease